MTIDRSGGTGPADVPDPAAEQRAERLAHRINLVRKARPVRLSHRGDLDAAVQAWTSALLARSAANLVLAGPVGTGKTWSAWEALERAVAAGWAGTWHVSTSAEWRDAIAPPVDRDLLRRMRAVDLLVLDDLGAARLNDWERECLLSVVDERWQHAKPIVITTNVDDATDALGERLSSRLADGAAVVVLDGPDLREGR